MPEKRKNDDVETPEVTSREKKKQKTVAARTIAVQPPTPSGSATPQNMNAVPGPSRLARTEADKRPLPGSLDVERFTEARAFEITAMHSAMKASRENASHRAWQELPRHLRRRAASHNVRRVPLRLRDKARSEMDPMRKKALGRSTPKRGRLKEIQRTASLLKRQKNKVWLETHIWHAKRMKMENMWGYRLAVQPTEKAFRPSHRASVHGSILHDASYFAFIEFTGPESVLCAILDRCCNPQGPSPGAKRFLAGARTCDTHIYKQNAYPFDLIAPITVIWNSGTSSNSSAPVIGQQGKGQAKARSKGKEKEKEQAPVPKRVLWIRVHPMVFEEVHLSLQTSTSFILEAVKAASGPENKQPVEVELADLRQQLNVFEIMGPKASQVMKGAFKLTPDAGRPDFSKFWQSLGNLQTTASLPRNMVIGFTVHDPRLSFPPKNAHVQLDKPNTTKSPGANLFPTSQLAESGIWNESTRGQLQKPKYKKKDLDERRNKNDIPGTPLQPKQDDNRVPVLLIQRSLESAREGVTPGSNMNSDNSPSLHGWTLIIPQGWSMPFFTSLIYTGTRVAGQRERQTQFFEAGKAYFPRDYPCTGAYESYASERGDEEREKWERKPPAKRPNYEALQTRSPWQPDWGVALGLKPASPDKDPSNFIETQRGEGTAVQITKPSLRPWLLCGPDIHTVLENVSAASNHAVGLREQIAKLRAKRNLSPLDQSVRADDLWKAALVRIKLRMCGRGRPDDLAMIYSMQDGEHKEWMKVMKKGAIIPVEEEETPLAFRTPSPDDIIGYVTTGNFSLSLGEGYAIGSIPVARLFELRQQAARLGSNSRCLVKVRDRAGTVCRAAFVDVLE